MFLQSSVLDALTRTPVQRIDEVLRAALLTHSGD